MSKLRHAFSLVWRNCVQADQLIVSVGETVRLHDHRVADDTLDRKPARVDSRTDAFDDGADATTSRNRSLLFHDAVDAASSGTMSCGFNNSTASGGSVMVSEKGRPCDATGAASTPP